MGWGNDSYTREVHFAAPAPCLRTKTLAKTHKIVSKSLRGASFFYHTVYIQLTLIARRVNKHTDLPSLSSTDSFSYALPT